jgi:DNA-binding SARP family transcriptional activator/Tfp pilus assembly protein PilF
MRFRVLGTLEVRSSDGQPVRLGSSKQRTLLAILLFSVNRPVDTGRLVEALWPLHPTRTAAVALRTYISALRQNLGLSDRSELATVAGGYEMRLTPADLDLLAFEELAGAGQAALADGNAALAAERLRRALDLWRGRPFEDVVLGGEPAAELVRLDERRYATQEAWIESQLTLGHHADVLTELAAMVAAQPLRERRWAQWMLALHRSGRRAEALRAYQDLRRYLEQELDVEPSMCVRRLHQRILAGYTDTAPPRAPAANRAVPRQLPPDIATFTGRRAELTQLLAPEPAGQPWALVITAINGMAGVGKTALAVHAAHLVADRYADGQLFVDLHGFTEGVAPVDPADALDRLLRDLGVPGDRIPHDLDARAGLYRSRLAGKRMLILLDNAATEAQTRPLLPGTPSCLVLVTSRSPLAEMVGARSLSLDVLPPSDALALFTRSVGEQRLAGEPPPVLAEIVDQCGSLPLAIHVAAARLRARPQWTAAHLAERLRDHRHRLAELSVGGLSVTTAIDLSNRQLTADARRTYRLLSLHPGPDLDAHAAAALTATTSRQAERVLDDLVDAHLLEEPILGRYRFHDLIRAHAAGAVATDETESGRRAALARLLDYYARTASMAMDVRYPFAAAGRPHISTLATPAPTFEEPAHAAAWLDTELTNLLALATVDWPGYTLHLSATLGHHLRTRAYHAHAQTLHDLALRIARASGDRGAEVVALCGLGEVYLMRLGAEQATRHFEQALAVALATANRTGELAALTGIGHIHRTQSRFELATDHFERALRIARATGNRTGQLNALQGLGGVRRHMGHHDEAADHFQEALDLARATANADGELNALWGLGHIHWLKGRRADSARFHEQALRIARTTGNRVGELHALTGLGYVHLLQGQYQPAGVYFGQILSIALEIGDRNSELEARYGLGHVQMNTGRPEAAIAHHQAVLDLARDLGQRTDQARALHGLACARRALGHHAQARNHWQDALDILTELGVPEAEELSVDEIRAHLAAYQE